MKPELALEVAELLLPHYPSHASHQGQPRLQGRAIKSLSHGGRSQEFAAINLSSSILKKIITFFLFLVGPMRGEKNKQTETPSAFLSLTKLFIVTLYWLQIILV